MQGPSRHHHSLDLRRDPSRGPMRPRRPVHQTGVALGVEPGHPAVGTLAGDPHRPSDMRHRHPLDPDPIHQQPTPKNRQTSITVTHQDLRWVEDDISTPPGGLHLCQGVTNLMAEYT